MRLFVAGATGVARSAEKAALVRGMGAQPVYVDLFDPVAVRAAVDAHDVVVNLATKIPPPSRAVFTRAWAQNNRLRTQASRNLVDASLETGVQRFVQESIAFIYPDSGDRWIDEDVPLDPPALGRTSQVAEAEASRFTRAGRAGVVLRFGQLYAADAVHTISMVRMARRRMPALPGPKGAYGPAIAAEDAAAGVVAALGAPAGVWNVTDDEPLTRAAYNRAVAEALGVKPPYGTGTVLLRLSPNTRFYLRSLRVSNRRFKAATGWSPRYPDAAAGWRAMVAEMPALR